MCKVGQLVDFVRKQLSDDETDFEETTWSRDLIREYLKSASVAVASDRPDFFSVVKEIELEAGCVHDIDDKCGDFGGVISVDGNDCAVEVEPNAFGRKLAARYRSNKCHQATAYNTPGSYYHGGIDFDPDNPTIFRTTNPVPNRGVTAKVYCSNIPDFSELGDESDLPNALCNKARPALIEMVLYQAFSKDAETEAQVAKAQLHFTNYATLLGISRRGRDDFHEPAN